MIEDSLSHRRIQVEQAAKGCVSGTGAEWPHLISALRFYGKHATSQMFALELRELAQQVCKEKGWLV